MMGEANMGNFNYFEATHTELGRNNNYGTSYNSSAFDKSGENNRGSLVPNKLLETRPLYSETMAQKLAFASCQQTG
jgi:hypothetical protein